MSWLRKVRWQFSLLSLMGCMLIVALSASLYGEHLRALERQEKAFRELSRKGFTVLLYDDGSTRLYGGSMRRLRCGTGIDRMIERSADNIFAKEDWALLDDVISLQLVDVENLRLPDECVEELQSRFPNTHVYNGMKGKY